MDGLLAIDKPVGPTSHDVVARVRRSLLERRVGHTGTLDPMASGVLPLVLGRATRLARFLSSGDKRYLGTVRLGWPTDTQDALGQPLRPAYTGSMPSAEAIEQALEAFRGTFMQQPPAFSAKKIDGRRSYQLARSHARDLLRTALAAAPARPALPAPVTVTARSVEIVGVDGDLITLSVVCSAGFYIRALAHDLGEALGVGAHLAALRRTETSGVSLEDAISVEEVEGGSQGIERARAAIIPLERMLPALARATLTREGAERVAKGRDVEIGQMSEPFPVAQDPGAAVRLFDPGGALIAIGEQARRPGILHPAVVLV